MKYKVLLYDINNTPEIGNFSFYTKSQAESCCQLWVAENANYRAYLWDGNTWRKYQ